MTWTSGGVGVAETTHMGSKARTGPLGFGDDFNWPLMPLGTSPRFERTCQYKCRQAETQGHQVCICGFGGAPRFLSKHQKTKNIDVSCVLLSDPVQKLQVACQAPARLTRYLSAMCASRTCKILLCRVNGFRVHGARGGLRVQPFHPTRQRGSTGCRITSPRVMCDRLW